jgi:hypothetical protein
MQEWHHVVTRHSFRWHEHLPPIDSAAISSFKGTIFSLFTCMRQAIPVNESEESDSQPNSHTFCTSFRMTPLLHPEGCGCRGKVYFYHTQQPVCAVSILLKSSRSWIGCRHPNEKRQDKLKIARAQFREFDRAIWFTTACALH